ncbi:MAG: SDR family oxidoreductase [bacterium]
MTGSRAWIIFVDDVEAEAVAISDLIERRFGANFRVRAFTTPAEALNFVRERAERREEVALVVTDMYMPVSIGSNGDVLHGDELAAMLHKQLDRSLPVLGYSGHSDYQNPEAAKAAGLVDLLPKDATHSDDLLNRIERILIDRYDMTSDSIFITGATGWLGRMLVDRLLKTTESNLFLLVREADGVPFDRRIEISDELKPRVSFVRGDLAIRGLGIGPADMLALRSTGPLEFWHLAACVDFDKRNHAAVMKANVEAAENLVEFIAKLPAGSCRVLNAVSTAYVAGEKQFPLVSSESIESTCHFKNGFEKSKARMEQIIRDSGLPYRIFRPSMIVGSSDTGEWNDEFAQGASAALAKMKSLGSGVNGMPTLHLPAVAHYRKNLICADDVVFMMTALRKANTGLREVFHLVNPHYARVCDIVDAAATVAGVEISYDSDLDLGIAQQDADFLEFANFTPVKPIWMDGANFEIVKALFPLLQYLTHNDPVFDCGKTAAALAQVAPGYSPIKTDREKIRYLLEGLNEMCANSVN